MNVSVRQLRAFVTIAKCQSFAEASELLHLSPSALSVSIQKLEDAVGGALFARSTRSLEITPEGKEFLPNAIRLLGDWDGALDDLNRSFNLKQGKLRIAVMPSFAMNQFPGCLVNYQTQYPEINISILDVVMEEVISAVLDGQVDLGITFEPENLDGLEFTPLFTDKFVAALPPDSRLEKCKHLDWKSLVQEPYIAMNRGSWTRSSTDTAMQEAGVVPPRLLEAGQLSTIGRMVSVGLGVAVVPRLCQEHMQAMGIQCRPIHSPTIERRVGIFTRKHQAISGAAIAFTQHLKEYFEKGMGLSHPLSKSRSDLCSTYLPTDLA